MPCVSQAKDSDEQSRIILLNDSASALEDFYPLLSKRMAQLADEKEKEWEYSNAHKDAPPSAVTVKDIPRLREQIQLLKAAAVDIQPTYPLIAQGLAKMAKDIEGTIPIEK